MNQLGVIFLSISAELTAMAKNPDAELLLVRRINPLSHEKRLSCQGGDEAKIEDGRQFDGSVIKGLIAKCLPSLRS